MQRRQLLGAGLAMAGASALRVGAAHAAPLARVRPGAPGWPTDADWAQLGQSVGGRLSRVPQPDLAGPDAAKLLANPFYIADTPALTESSGWLDAWRSQASAWMVDAKSAADVAAAVRFAAAHNLRLVVKGRGHSYLGGSNAPDSLLIWTRHMDDVTVHDAFTPAGSNARAGPGRLLRRRRDVAARLSGGRASTPAATSRAAAAPRWASPAWCRAAASAASRRASAPPAPACSRPRSSPPTARCGSSTTRRTPISSGR